MRISDWSSDVCSSDLRENLCRLLVEQQVQFAKARTLDVPVIIFGLQIKRETVGEQHVQRIGDGGRVTIFIGHGEHPFCCPADIAEADDFFPLKLWLSIIGKNDETLLMGSISRSIRTRRARCEGPRSSGSPPRPSAELGRAAGRERVCKYVEI